MPRLQKCMDYVHYCLLTDRPIALNKLRSCILTLLTYQMAPRLLFHNTETKHTEALLRPNQRSAKSK